MQWAARPHRMRCAERRTRAVRTRPLHGARASGRRPGPSKKRAIVAPSSNGREKGKEVFRREIHKKCINPLKRELHIMGTCLQKTKLLRLVSGAFFYRYQKDTRARKKASTVVFRPRTTCNTSRLYENTGRFFVKNEWVPHRCHVYFIN